MLEQYRNEVATKCSLQRTNKVVATMIKTSLGFTDIPRNVPIFHRNMGPDGEEKKMSTWKTKSKSVLKINNKDLSEFEKHKQGFKKLSGTTIDSRIKIIYNKKDISPVLVPKQKNFQSVLKAKNITLSKKLIKEGSQSPESVSSSSSVEIKEKSRSSSPIDSADHTVSSKHVSRFGKKYEGKVLASSKAKSSDQNASNKSE